MVQSNSPAPADLLPAVIQAVRQAGASIRKEFHRPGGPRGEKNKAPIDEEVEFFLRRGGRILLR
jgi:ADP-ribosyl-[dinitrogen reductase] hydrolase